MIVVSQRGMCLAIFNKDNGAYTKSSRLNKQGILRHTDLERIDKHCLHGKSTHANQTLTQSNTQEHSLAHMHTHEEEEEAMKNEMK